MSLPAASLRRAIMAERIMPSSLLSGAEVMTTCIVPPSIQRRAVRRLMAGPIDGKEESLVIVNVNCNFYSPAYFTENIEVLTGVESIGDKSLRLEQRVVNADTGDVKCVCHTVMAAFDPVAVRAIPVSDMWRSRIGEFEGRDM